MRRRSLAGDPESWGTRRSPSSGIRVRAQPALYAPRRRNALPRPGKGRPCAAGRAGAAAREAGLGGCTLGSSELLSRASPPRCAPPAWTGPRPHGSPPRLSRWRSEPPRTPSAPGFSRPMPTPPARPDGPESSPADCILYAWTASSAPAPRPAARKAIAGGSSTTRPPTPAIWTRSRALPGLRELYAPQLEAYAGLLRNLHGAEARVLRRPLLSAPAAAGLVGDLENLESCRHGLQDGTGRAWTPDARDAANPSRHKFFRFKKIPCTQRPEEAVQFSRGDPWPEICNLRAAIAGRTSPSPLRIRRFFRNVVIRPQNVARIAVQAKKNDSGGSGYRSGSAQGTPVICSGCGQPTTVPFEPRGDRPVFCRDCYQARKGSGGGSSRGNR